MIQHDRVGHDRVRHDRVWRRDRDAMLSGVCAGLAEDLDLPLPLIRAVAVIFLLLPTGLAYLALSMLLRRGPVRARSRLGIADRAPLAQAAAGQTRNMQGQTMQIQNTQVQNWALLQHRFEALEPRLKRIEAFVTSKDFELHRDFRAMDEQSGPRRNGG